MRKRSSIDRDEGAFALLYERHRASVLAVCMGVLGSRQDAEDASQETFAALAVALRADTPRDVRAWLTRVARNAAIDLIRQRRPTESADDELADRATTFDRTPAELQSVLDGIRELPEAQRTALLMRELAGHSYREIASLLEIEEPAVRGLIARARIGLRDHREASEMPCASAREAIAAEPDPRPRDRGVRRHVRSCSACRAYMQGLRDDARVLRGLLPFSGGGIAGGGALLGGLGTKGALLGGVLSQVGLACAAVSVCAMGSVILIGPRTHAHARAGRASSRSAHVAHAARSRSAGSAPSVAASVASNQAAARTTSTASAVMYRPAAAPSAVGHIKGRAVAHSVASTYPASTRARPHPQLTRQPVRTTPAHRPSDTNPPPYGADGPLGTSQSSGVHDRQSAPPADASTGAGATPADGSGAGTSRLGSDPRASSASASAHMDNSQQQQQQTTATAADPAAAAGHLKVAVVDAETVTRRRHRRTVTVTTTVTARFNVC